MGPFRNNLGFITASSLVLLCSFTSSATACSNRTCKLKDECKVNGDCGDGLYCFSCPAKDSLGSRCVRSSTTDQFKLLNNSLPFNKYAFLTTHNSFALAGGRNRHEQPRITFTNQEDTITQQLQNGVRALMLDTYDYKDGVWLCHSFRGQCHRYTAFGPAIDTLTKISDFLLSNPTAIITLILEDYVKVPNGLTKVFQDSGLKKFWFPVSEMPRNGQDWPLVKDMVAKNHRLIVFTSDKSKQQSEGIAYQWDYMVESQYGDNGINYQNCHNRKESALLDDKSKSLVLVNYFETIPTKKLSCDNNSEDLKEMLQACHKAAGNRWANFVAVDYYKRSDGGGAFEAVDSLNGRLVCGCNDVHACVHGSARRCIH